MSRSLFAIIFSFAVLSLAGCGGPAPVPVTGKVILPPGIKLNDSADKPDTVTIVFVPDEGETAVGGNANLSPKDLNFTAQVVPGKYKVSVNIQQYPGAAGGRKEVEARNKELSALFGAFSGGATPFRYEVTKDANQSITLDLNKKTLSK